VANRNNSVTICLGYCNDCSLILSANQFEYKYIKLKIMAKNFVIRNTQDSGVYKICLLKNFDQSKTEEYPFAYSEILKILREAFKLVEINQIIKKA